MGLIEVDWPWRQRKCLYWGQSKTDVWAITCVHVQVQRVDFSVPSCLAPPQLFSFVFAWIIWRIGLSLQLAHEKNCHWERKKASTCRQPWFILYYRNIMREGEAKSSFGYNQSICTQSISGFLLKFLFFPPKKICSLEWRTFPLRKSFKDSNNLN